MKRKVSKKKRASLRNISFQARHFSCHNLPLFPTTNILAWSAFLYTAHAVSAINTRTEKKYSDDDENGKMNEGEQHAEDKIFSSPGRVPFFLNYAVYYLEEKFLLKKAFFI